MSNRLLLVYPMEATNPEYFVGAKSFYMFKRLL
jgi:hypothetical protein